MKARGINFIKMKIIVPWLKNQTKSSNETWMTMLKKIFNHLQAARPKIKKKNRSAHHEWTVSKSSKFLCACRSVFDTALCDQIHRYWIVETFSARDYYFVSIAWCWYAQVRSNFVVYISYSWYSCFDAHTSKCHFDEQTRQFKWTVKFEFWNW